ncbi:MAG: winged helix-turn-helix domain-containing protein, partial [Clostridia bacterium]|nr:winged helix-turn-helix domain-containing protein [Clostridia bacterium]
CVSSIADGAKMLLRIVFTTGMLFLLTIAVVALARIRVMTRSVPAHTSVYTAADLTVNCASRTVKRGNDTIDLSPKEFALLEYMIVNKGVVLSREAIEDHIYDVDYEGGSNVVNVYIRFLRRKIDEPYEKKLIHTVRGAGYVLREE